MHPAGPAVCRLRGKTPITPAAAPGELSQNYCPPDYGPGSLPPAFRQAAFNFNGVQTLASRYALVAARNQAVGELDNDGLRNAVQNC